MKTSIPRFLSYYGLILSFATLLPGKVNGENTSPADTAHNVPAKEVNSPKLKSFKMTTLTFGGNGINLTKVNTQFTIMTGGRGAATFNDRYTIGGGGWGMTRGVEVESTTEGIYNFVKMGYGGIDFGYLVYPGEKFNLGSRLLIGGGAVFNETVPESKNNSFKMFPVIEPAVYYQVSLGKLFRFEMGASYRFIRGTNLPFISDKELSGFSCYLGLLVRAGESK
jgi:hypothetical protein